MSLLLILPEGKTGVERRFLGPLAEALWIRVGEGSMQTDPGKELKAMA